MQKMKSLDSASRNIVVQMFFLHCVSEPLLRSGIAGSTESLIPSSFSGISLLYSRKAGATGQIPQR